jgi:hypothetical protein
MTKGSTSGAVRSRPPAHQNETAFRHNKSSKKTKKILESPISDLLCPSCKMVIEWRKQYRKYKPLTVPKKCTSCQEKKIKAAYHTRCDPCASKSKVCAKCGDPRSYDEAKASAKLSYNPATEDTEPKQELSEQPASNFSPENNSEEFSEDESDIASEDASEDESEDESEFESSLDE